MKGLLDGDIVVFRCGFAAERTCYHLKVGDEVQTFDRKSDALDELDKKLPGKFSRVEGEDYDLWPEKVLEPLANALQNVKTLINRICEELNLDPQFDLEVFLSDGRNFRHEVAVTRPYKGTRKEEHRPTYEKEIRAYIRENYDTYVAENEEADDLIGTRATELGEEEAIIISLDKDLDMIPCLHYNWVHDIAYRIKPDEAMYQFHLQLMSGDTTDNIPGLPGIGPGKGKKALHGAETPSAQLAEVIRMYQIHSGKEDWMEYLREQGRLIWIRRHKDEDWAELLESHLADEAIGMDADWVQSELQLEVD